MDNLSHAVGYLKKGFSVIPVKPDKTPYIKWEPFQKRLASEQEISDWWQKWPDAMIGIVTGKISNLAVIDVDTDEGLEAIQEYIPDSLLMPIADTPSGGLHMYFRCPDPPLGNNSRLITGCDLRCEGGYIVAPPSINDTGRAYKWQEGFGLDEVALSPLPSAYIVFIKDFAFRGYKGDEANNTPSDFLRLPMTSNDFQEGMRDETLFHLANCLIKGGCEEPLARKALTMLALQCDPPFDLNEANVKIDSALKRSNRRRGEISEAVREWVLTSNGFFLTSNVFQELRLTSREEQKAAWLTLNKLCKEKVIEKHGEKRGGFRVIDNQCEDIDFINATDTVIPVKWPFGIERYFNTMPKNIIVVAGEPDAGKTAFLLNVARLNMHGQEVVYFSSEMGAQELRGRLSKFDEPLNTWKKLTVKERSDNFADVVRPDAINIIDFLEIHDEFYKIGGYIKQIFDKLDKGIAVIAIQKNKNAEYGLGGGRGLEKARLYLSMESGKIRIIKAKNWADSAVNPNGLEMGFKLVKGCHFIEEGYWKK